jgi:2-iminobutanoate/2-iminopropanoate deaminase
LPGTPEAQIAQAFANVRQLLEMAGGGPADLAKVDVRLADLALRPAVNAAWVAMFPDPDDRPVRHVSKADLTGGHLIQLEIVAHLDPA